MRHATQQHIGVLEKHIIAHRRIAIESRICCFDQAGRYFLAFGRPSAFTGATAAPLGLDTWTASRPPKVRSMCHHYSITKNPAAIRDLFKVAHDTTGAAAVRRVKVLKLIEPKEAPVEKPDK
jgi:hypothetical protein